MTSQESSVQERVARGVELLDERFPDWWADVNIDTLELDSSEACVVQQVWGQSYWHVRDSFAFWMRMSRDQAQDFFVARGFDVDRLEVQSSRNAYDLLTQAWKSVIETRRAGA